MDSQKIISFIDKTVKDYCLIFNDYEGVDKLIKAIIGRMPPLSQTTREVVEYCKYRYNIDCSFKKITTY